MNQDGQVVIFELGGSKFCMDSSSVTEIIEPEGIIRIPDVPDFVEGIVNLRGNTFAVINLGEKLGCKKPRSHSNPKILMCDLGSEVIGFLVDDVFGIIASEEVIKDQDMQMIEPEAII